MWQSVTAQKGFSLIRKLFFYKRWTLVHPVLFGACTHVILIEVTYACFVMCSGLDADLLAVIPAFSRHPSLKHLMLGKNFNIKGRYGTDGEPAAQMAAEALPPWRMSLLFSLPPQGAGGNSAEAGSFGARGRVCELDWIIHQISAYTRHTHSTITVQMCLSSFMCIVESKWVQSKTL